MLARSLAVLSHPSAATFGAQLGGATFARVTQRLSATTTAQAAPIGRVAYATALVWAPLAVAASLLTAVLIWAGVGLTVLAYAILVVAAFGLYLAFVATGATLAGTAAFTRIAIVLAAAVAAYLVDRLVWALVG